MTKRWQNLLGFFPICNPYRCCHLLPKLEPFFCVCVTIARAHSLHTLHWDKRREEHPASCVEETDARGGVHRLCLDFTFQALVGSLNPTRRWNLPRVDSAKSNMIHSTIRIVSGASQRQPGKQNKNLLFVGWFSIGRMVCLSRWHLL